MSMSPGEFRDILAVLGLTKTEAAKLLERDWRTVHRWWRGDTPVPRLVAFALGVMVKKHERKNRKPAPVEPDPFAHLGLEKEPEHPVPSWWPGADNGK